VLALLAKREKLVSVFEVGKTYRVTTLEGDEQSYSSYVLEGVENTLIKLSQPGRSLVLNTASPAFVSAELDDPEARAAAEAEWLDSLSEDDKAL
jgi:hypothetical protein